MSFLSGLLTVVGAVAAVVLSGGSALGLLAGGMLAVSAAAQFGLIGGSLGKFAQSGLFKGLTAAVSLGSAAYAMYGASAAQAGETAAAATEQGAAAAPAGTGVLQTEITAGQAADMQAAALTNTSFIQSANMVPEVAQAQLADPALSQVSGVSTQTLNDANQTLMGTSQNASASQASAQETASTTNAVQPQGGTPGMPGTKPLGAPAGAGEGGGVTPGTPAADATVPSTGAAPGATGPYQVPDSAPGTPPSWGERVGGMLSSALDTKGGAAAVQGIGSMVGGIGSGIAQKQAMEDQIRAQQWGNMQWQNQGQVAQLQSAAAKPITVPQGYLQRAAQVRSLMSGSAGMQPLPTAQPGAPLAPSPVHA